MPFPEESVDTKDLPSTMAEEETKLHVNTIRTE